MVIPNIKHNVELIFGPRPLSGRAEKESDVEKTPVYALGKINSMAVLKPLKTTEELILSSVCTKCGRAGKRELKKTKTKTKKTCKR